MTTETLPQTFATAAECVQGFAERFRDGKASISEIEDADIMLLGLRRLLADYKHEKARAANAG